MRGRFRVNITAPIVIRMAITSHAAGIAIDLIYKLRREEIAAKRGDAACVDTESLQAEAPSPAGTANGPRCRSRHRAK